MPNESIDRRRPPLPIAAVKPPVSNPVRLGSISEEDQNRFGSEDWQPSSERLTPLVTALWRGVDQFCYVVQNAEVVSPAAIDYLAAAGQWIRRTWSRSSFRPLRSEADALRDMIERLDQTRDFLADKLGG